MKKGQVTVFIILGILILFSIAIASYLYQRQTRTPTQIIGVPETLDPQLITDYVNSCIKKIAQEGVYKLAAQGGYLNPRGDKTYLERGDSNPVHYHYEDYLVPYAVNKEVVSLRPLSEVSIMLNRYLASNIDSCLNFSQLENKGFAIDKPAINWTQINFSFSDTTVDYSPQKISVVNLPRFETSDLAVSLTYPLRFTKEDESFTVSEFFTTIPLRLALTHKIAQLAALDIASGARLGTPYDVSQNCLKFATQDGRMNVYVDFNPNIKDHLVSVVDSNPLIYGLPPLRYQFAVRNIDVYGRCIA